MRAFAVQERSYLVAIAANGHGAPAAAMGAGIVVEKKGAGRIGAAPYTGFGAFHQEFRGRASDGREQPFHAVFPREELQAPHTVGLRQFIVPFGDAENLVDGLRPHAWERALFANGGENGAKGFAQAQHFEQDAVDGLRFVLGKGTQAARAIFAGDPSGHQEGHEFIPGNVVRMRRKIGKIQREAAGNQADGLKSGTCHVWRATDEAAARLTRIIAKIG
jgi:hypothetical protein